MSILVAEKQPKSQRLQVVISLQTHAFLSLLAGKGTHGASATDVARTFIEHGIREALEKGHLNDGDRAAVQKSSK